MTVIPIMTCFDNNYCIAAAPCFLSLMTNADRQYYYKIYVLHNDITKENQLLLKETIKDFPNGDIEFIDMEGRYQDIYDKVSKKMHFTKEVLYKFLPQVIFPQHDKMIVTDVDVLFLGDIAPSFFALDVEEDCYFAGIRVPKISTLKNQVKEFNRLYGFSKADLYCGGYIVSNLKKMREDHLEEKFIQFMLDNVDKVQYMEQDALSAVCYSKIKNLPFRTLVCNYHYRIFDQNPEFLTRDTIYTADEFQEGLDSPVQLHYAHVPKPWVNVTSTKGLIWLDWFLKTPYKHCLEQILDNSKDYLLRDNGKLRKKIRIIKNFLIVGVIIGVISISIATLLYFLGFRLW